MRENMVNVGGPRRAGCPDLTAFHWLMRGGQTRYCECIFCVKDVAVAGCTSICFVLCCLIVGESFFPAYPAERWALNGKVKVMLLTILAYDVFAIDELHSTALGKGHI